MTRRTIIMLAVMMLGSASADAGSPKLAKCTGPARYANPYGSVLPSLPIPGEPAPPQSVSPPSASQPVPASPEPQPTGTRPAAPPAAAPTPRTGALLPYYPSC